MEPFTVLTPTPTNTSISTRRMDGPTPMIHPSQALPISGKPNSDTFKEWCEQFELVAAACG